MIDITNLTLKNFLSVGAVTSALRLNQNGLTLILGSNTDSNGAVARNGAGKTTILQAISYALYGTPISKIKVDNLINNINQKGMLVTIDFERGGIKYRVERGRKPNVLRLFIDSEEFKESIDQSQGENRHTQDAINDAIGMSHTMFKHIVALNTYTDPFLRMRAGEQREVIEELLGVTQISQRAEILKKLIAKTKESLRDEEATLRATRESNNRIQSAIDNAMRMADSWDRAHAGRLAELTDQIEALEGIDYDAEISAFDGVDRWVEDDRQVRDGLDTALRDVQHYMREIGTIEAQIAEARKLSQAGENPQIARSRKEIDRKQSDIKNRQTQLEKYRADREKVVSDLDSPDTKICVCCDQKLDGTDHLETVLTSLRNQITSLDCDIARVQADISSIETEAMTIQTEIGTLTEADAKRVADAEVKIVELSAELDGPSIKLKEAEDIRQAWEMKKVDIGDKPKTTFMSRDEVYKAKALFDGLARDLEIEASKENPNTAQVNTLKETLQEVNTEAADHLADLMKHQELVLKLLTSKDSFIRKKIVDQNLSYLNSRLTHYLEKMGLPHEVKFNSDLTVDITSLGRDFDFEQLSRGEMNRVIMSTSWAFRDVWESLNDSFNLMFVDEMLDQGTDAVGVEAALGILKGMVRDRGKEVFLISHRDDLMARIDRILLVRKENGFTSFEENSND